MDKVSATVYGSDAVNDRGQGGVFVQGALDTMEVTFRHPSGLVLNVQPNEEGFDIYMTEQPSTVEVQGTPSYPVVRVVAER